MTKNFLYFEKFLNRIKIITIILLFVFLGISALISNSSAEEINISEHYISPSSIYWNWTNLGNLTHVYIDGKNVSNFAPNTDYYILSGLEENSTHRIDIENQINNVTFEYGSKESTTLVTSGTQITDSLVPFLVFFVGVIFVLLGIVGVPYAGFLGIPFGVYGILTQYNSVGSTIMYLVLIVASLIIGLDRSDF